MGLKKSNGNMYPWVTHMHTHLIGACSHKCSYCYTLESTHEKWQGPTRLEEPELKLDYGSGKVIFIEHYNDLFASDVPAEVIRKVLAHCCAYPDNEYVFQTKNPFRYWDFESAMPHKFMRGVTMETNRATKAISTAPNPWQRSGSMWLLPGKKFVTIEPILKFDLDEFCNLIIREVEPDFVNIGADSKNHGLEEPTIEEVEALAERLTCAGIEVLEKHNMNRLRK